jgi:formate-nitrite transporter family protein
VFAAPTLAGNIIGGSFIFALISHAQVRSETNTPLSRQSLPRRPDDAGDK